MTYKDIVDLYLRLLNRLSKELGRYDEDVPSITSQDVSFLLSNWSKYQLFHEKVVKQPVFDTDGSRSLLELFYQSLTPVKTIFDKLKSLSDYNKTDKQTLDLLLKTFGFNYLYFPTPIKRQLLVKLVGLYKKKGTLKALEEVLNIVSTLNVSVSEVYFEKVKGEPKFVYDLVLEATGISHKNRFYLDPGRYIENDPHWFITKEELRNWPISKAITPYINITGVVDLQCNLKSVILLRTYAAKDYQIYLDCLANGGDMTDYEKTKVINPEMLPRNINFLELYELIRYMYLKKLSRTHLVSPLPDNVPTYSYRPPDTEVDVIIDELHKQFQTRHIESGQATSLTRVTSYEAQITHFFLTSLPGQVETQKLILENLTGARCITTGTSIIIAGGIDKTTNDYNRRVYILDIYSMHTYVIDTEIECVKPVIVISKTRDEVQIGGGYTLEGNPNYKCWVLSLVDYSCYRVMDIPDDMWMENPLVVVSNSSCYVVSRSYNDKCPGAIFEWNLHSHYKRLVALIDSEDYDITTIQGCATDLGNLYFAVVSRLSNSTRIIYLNPTLGREIFADITCLLIRSVPNLQEKIRISEALRNNNAIILANGNHLLIISRHEDLVYYWIAQAKVTEGPVRSKIYPRRFSGVLLPSRLCYLCPRHDVDICAKESIVEFLSKRQWDNVKVSEVGYDYMNDFLFIKVFDNLNNSLHPYWPLVQQIRSIPCQSKTATIEMILPNIEILYDHSLVRVGETLEKDPTKVSPRYDLESFKIVFPRFYFLDFDTYLRLMGAYTNVDESSFRDLYKVKAGISNDHFCYVLYDNSEKYDIECNLELVCYSRLPDYIEGIIPEDKQQDFEKTYKVMDTYEWIIINYLTKLYGVLTTYFILPTSVLEDYCIASSMNRIVVCRDVGNCTEVYLLLKYPYIEKLIPLDFTFEYDDSGTGRRKRTQLMEERRQKLIGPEALPNFQSFEELSAFLNEVTSDNKRAIDSAPEAELNRIQFELLYLVSNLYPDADLSTLMPGGFTLPNLYPIINMFKPIYTRYLYPGIVAICSDPTADWIAMTDSFECQVSYTCKSYISLSDYVVCYIEGGFPE